MKHAIFIVIVCVAAMCGVPKVLAADQAADKAAIEKAIESYTTAFNARDAKALAEHWGPEAVYVNPLTGVQVEGRDAIVKEFESIFTDLKDAKFE